MGKSKTNKQNPLNHKSLLNSPALSTKHLGELLSSVRVTRQELFRVAAAVSVYGGCCGVPSTGSAVTVTGCQELWVGSRGTRQGNRAEPLTAFLCVNNKGKTGIRALISLLQECNTILAIGVKGMQNRNGK